MDDNEVRKILSTPGVIALTAAAIRFMLMGGRESPVRIVGYLLAAGGLAYLAGPYLALKGYPAEEIALASAAIGFVIPNILMGILNLVQRFKDDPMGFIVDVLKRFGKK